MKRIVFSVFVIVALIGFVVTQGHAQTTSIRDEVQSLLNRAAVAFDKENVAGVTKIALPSAKLHYLDGTVLTVDQWTAGMVKNFGKMEKGNTEFKVIKAEATGSSGTATYTAKHEYILSADKMHQYLRTRRWKVDLTKTLEGWRITRFEQLSEEMTRDGKPYKEEPGTEKF